jgi:hypothetical protein
VQGFAYLGIGLTLFVQGGDLLICIGKLAHYAASAKYFAASWTASLSEAGEPSVWISCIHFHLRRSLRVHSRCAINLSLAQTAA